MPNACCPEAGRHETAQGEALIARHNARGGHFPIPKGLRPKAQGFEERATLGGMAESPTTPTGLRPFNPRLSTYPHWVAFLEAVRTQGRPVLRNPGHRDVTPLGLKIECPLTQGRPASRSNSRLRDGIPLGFQTGKLANLQTQGIALGTFMPPHLAAARQTWPNSRAPSASMARGTPAVRE